MENLISFVSQHMADDLTRLILDRARWPEIDMDMLLLDIGTNSCIFDDYEFIKQKTELVMNELLGYD